jgi:hypothetical protein
MHEIWVLHRTKRPTANVCDGEAPRTCKAGHPSVIFDDYIWMHIFFLKNLSGHTSKRTSYEKVILVVMNTA